MWRWPGGGWRRRRRVWGRKVDFKIHPKDQCVLIKDGKGWPVDNRRQGRGEPETLPANSIGYLERQGERRRSRVFVVGKNKTYWIDNADIEPFDPTTTHVRSDPKICLSCHRLKPLAEFDKNQTNRSGQSTTRPRCRECFRIESGKNLTSKTIREFRERVGAPEKGDLWQCPCCHKFSIAEVNAETRVDHDQERRKPRGIICDSCNTGLGRFKNGEDHLADAAAYIRRYEEAERRLEEEEHKRENE